MELRYSYMELRYSYMEPGFSSIKLGTSSTELRYSSVELAPSCVSGMRSSAKSATQGVELCMSSHGALLLLVVDQFS